MVEHRVHIAGVTGSSPVSTTNILDRIGRGFFHNTMKGALSMPQKRACSRVISVRYGTGCYRHLRIPSSYTLEELAEAILEAFDFINDHAHAFFMDDRCW